ncbi:argininosuccinate synthase [Candidatus Sumerlaeota bacterium]|nr:argininosuccinate synthase [Candidatus Sumerlaeota bacterium]
MSPSKPHVKKCVLAYSGGLDTSVIIRWLIENTGCEVVAFSADLGQGENLEPLRRKAIRTGASKIVIEDLRQEFVRDFVSPSIQANALYEGKYPLATALGRPLIAKWLVQIAKAEGADAVAHGCTGKGNDQVRFEVVTNALGPELKVLAPVREWELKTREEEIEYARKHRIPVQATAAKPYSFDSNLWGRSIECGALEDPAAEPPEDAWQSIVSPQKAPNKPLVVEIGFTRGVPTSLDGKKMKTLDLIERLNKIGERHGVGRIDMVENRLVGIKSRELYEAPAAVMILTAHKELEAMCLDREVAHFKPILEGKMAELIYYGLWYSPLREAISAFMAEAQKKVTGSVRLKLYKGSIMVIGRESRHSLYDPRLATYDVGDRFDHTAAEGFIQIFGLPSKVLARRK